MPLHEKPHAPVNRPSRIRVILMGAAGRDFHNFNQVYRDDPYYEVMAFTTAQIGGITGRCYPPVLAGSLYPTGIPIVAETEVETLCREQAIDQVVFAYSDVPHAQVMHLASRALAVGTDFILLGPARTMLKQCNRAMSNNPFLLIPYNYSVYFNVFISD